MHLAESFCLSHGLLLSNLYGSYRSVDGMHTSNAQSLEFDTQHNISQVCGVQTCEPQVSKVQGHPKINSLKTSQGFLRPCFNKMN